jgi:transcriptional regulator with XRE-family HTH domain
VAANRPKPPTVRQRRLASQLRRLRTEAQLSRAQVEERTGINEVTLYRIETARSRPQKRTLIALLDLYEVTGALRTDLLDIAKTADDQGWLRPYHAELPEEYAAYISFEAEARATRNYESLYIPGLLQTEDYARAILTCDPKASDGEVAERLTGRMARQKILSQNGSPDSWFVIDSAVLGREVGGRKVMYAALRHLAEMARRPNVTPPGHDRSDAHWPAGIAQHRGDHRGGNNCVAG